MIIVADLLYHCGSNLEIHPGSAVPHSVGNYLSLVLCSKVLLDQDAYCEPRK